MNGRSGPWRAMLRVARRFLGDRAYRAAVKRRKSAPDLLVAGLFFLVSNARVFGSRLLRTPPATSPGRILGHLRRFVRHGIQPNETLCFGDHLDAVLRERDGLILQVDLTAFLRRHLRDADLSVMQSKWRFAEACRRHQLPHPPTVRIEAGRPVDGGQLPDGTGIFVKPELGSAARGVGLLVRDADRRWTLHERHARRSAERWQELLHGHCPGEALVAQPWLENHHALRSLAGSGLVVFRMVTAMAPDGTCTLLSALAEVPLDEGRPLARRHATLPVDCSSGCLAAMSADRVAVAGCHPVTGTALSGASIPCWGEAADLAARAHRRLAAAVPLIGWDLAVTDTGPVLIEANINWAVAPHYRNDGGLDLRPGAAFRETLARHEAVSPMQRLA